MKPLNEVAEHYFNTLNPIAERISSDIVAIKDAYEDLWNCLSSKEKNQIINETVVHPEAILKYTLSTKSCEGVSLDVPLLTRQVTGAKYIVDESTGLSWRDEHSGPFSWKTPSQIDLSLFTSSKGEIENEEENKYINNNNSTTKNIKPNYLSFSQGEKTFASITKKEETSIKKNDKNDKKKGSAQAPNVVLVGTCSRLTGFCSKLKFLPGKSYSYEVQTFVSNPSNDASFLERLKSSAAFKFQNTFKLVSGKNVDKKAEEYKETQNLVQPKTTATIVKLSKPSPKIAKPKSPPPPPPAVVPTQKNVEKVENKTERNSVFVKINKVENSQDEKDSEKATLLGENSVQSFFSADSSEQDRQSKVTHELSDDFNSISTECTPLSGPSTDIIPKSGFDFLDNW